MHEWKKTALAGGLCLSVALNSRFSKSFALSRGFVQHPGSFSSFFFGDYFLFYLHYCELSGNMHLIPLFFILELYSLRDFYKSLWGVSVTIHPFHGHCGGPGLSFGSSIGHTDRSTDQPTNSATSWWIRPICCITFTGLKIETLFSASHWPSRIYVIRTIFDTQF